MKAHSFFAVLPLSDKSSAIHEPLAVILQLPCYSSFFILLFFIICMMGRYKNAPAISGTTNPIPFQGSCCGNKNAVNNRLHAKTAPFPKKKSSIFCVSPFKSARIIFVNKIKLTIPNRKPIIKPANPNTPFPRKSMFLHKNYCTAPHTTCQNGLFESSFIIASFHG